jgi:hypothetical protein
MPKLPAARQGEPLLVNRKHFQFSVWPVKKNKRYGLSSILFLSNPWGLIRNSIRSSSPASCRDEAIAFAAQAEDYLTAAFRRFRVCGGIFH